MTTLVGAAAALAIITGRSRGTAEVTARGGASQEAAHMVIGVVLVLGMAGRQGHLPLGRFGVR